MKILLTSLLLLASCFSTALAEPKEKKRYEIYAQFTEDTPVELSTGAKWMMDKGDCFPVYMFKEHQTQVVLRLASATFTTEMRRMRIVKESEMEPALQSYRKNVDSFLKTQSEAWQKEATHSKKSEN